MSARRIITVDRAYGIGEHSLLTVWDDRYGQRLIPRYLPGASTFHVLFSFDRKAAVDLMQSLEKFDLRTPHSVCIGCLVTAIEASADGMAEVRADVDIFEPKEQA